MLAGERKKRTQTLLLLLLPSNKYIKRKSSKGGVVVCDSHQVSFIHTTPVSPPAVGNETSCTNEPTLPTLIKPPTAHTSLRGRKKKPSRWGSNLDPCYNQISFHVGGGGGGGEAVEADHTPKCRSPHHLNIKIQMSTRLGGGNIHL
jgi:hypothetical protein